MSLTTIESLLEHKIGLSVDTIGSDIVASAIRRRMEECKIPDSAAYLDYLNTSSTEWDNLVEAVIVPETWFFRNEESFAYLGWYLKSEWIPKHSAAMLRILSIPCSTGEEPYSIAITVLNVGLPQDRFLIDAVDISRKGLQKAQHGVYGPESFRRQHTLQFLERYFTPDSEGYQIIDSIRRTVRFMLGNILDEQLLAKEKPYDIIFCRNLLIYLGSTAKECVIQTLDRLLAKTGLLFVGHAERPAFNGSAVEWIRQSGVFACRKSGPSGETPTAVPPKKRQSVKKQERKPPAAPKFPTLPQVQSVSIPQRNGMAVPVAIARAASLNKSPQATTATGVEFFERARQLADQGELEEALRMCERSLRQNAVNVHCHFLMGLIYQALGNEKNAEECLNRVVYLDPNHQEALSYMAFIATRRGEHHKATLLRQRMERIQQKLQVQ